jgi:hypothetical protein
MRKVRALAVILLLIGGAPLVFSQTTQQTPAKNGKKYVATKEIIFDKASGQLRKPTVEETEALVDQISSLTNRSAEGLKVVAHDNGTKSMSLEGRFNAVVLGRALADGTTEVRCVTTMQEAMEFLGLEESTSQQ